MSQVAEITQLGPVKLERAEKAAFRKWKDARIERLHREAALLARPSVDAERHFEFARLEENRLRREWTKAARRYREAAGA